MRGPYIFGATAFAGLCFSVATYVGCIDYIEPGIPEPLILDTDDADTIHEDVSLSAPSVPESGGGEPPRRDGGATGDAPPPVDAPADVREGG